ncbi:MAG: sigma-70 family RNA polymerase sigma factor [Pseudomonadota bacterium]
MGKIQQKTTSDDALEDVSLHTPQVESLYKSYAKNLSAALRKMYGDGPPDPDDVSQQAFQQVIEKVDVSTIKNLKAFMWRTARNLMHDSLKSQHSRSKYDFEVEHLYFSQKGSHSSPETVILAREQLRAINEVLKKMPDKKRRAIMLYRMEGITHKEIARRLKISRPMVTKYIASAHAEISALFVDDNEV